jgi:hypothetical protein
MFKGFNNRQQNGFPSLSFGKNDEAYNFNKCILWLDAAYGTNTITNGANISSWVDKISGVRYTQGTAGNQPTYVASDANFNNLPTINFGTATDRFLNGSSTFGIGATTIAIIIRMTGNATLASMILGNTTNAGFGANGAGASVTGFGFYATGTPSTISDIEDTSMHIVIANRNFIMVDGLNETTSTSVNTFNFTGIGSSFSNSQPNCIIAEILIYDYEMSQTEAIQLSSNINAKYLKY